MVQKTKKIVDEALISEFLAALKSSNLEQGGSLWLGLGFSLLLEDAGGSPLCCILFPEGSLPSNSGIPFAVIESNGKLVIEKKLSAQREYIVFPRNSNGRVTVVNRFRQMAASNATESLPPIETEE